MNIRMTIGFISGAIAVVCFWWILQGKPIEEKTMAAGTIDNAASRNKAVEIRDTSVPEPSATETVQGTAGAIQSSDTEESKDVQEQTLKEKTGILASGETSTEEKTETVETGFRSRETQTADSSVPSAPSDLDPDLYSSGAKQADPLPHEESSGETEPSSVPITETDSFEKNFFWKPFSLKSKAEKFAGHVSAESGVDCRVEKTGVGRYQVYFLYEGEADQAVKVALIQKTGLKL